MSVVTYIYDQHTMPNDTCLRRSMPQEEAEAVAVALLHEVALTHQEAVAAEWKRPPGAQSLASDACG